MTTLIDHLGYVRLDPRHGVSRAALPGVTVLSEDFWTGYDQYTVVYDAFLDARNLLHVFCPPLVNLKDGVLDGLRAAGIGVAGTSRVTEARYFIHIEQKNWDPSVATVDVPLFGHSYSLRINRQDTELFAGKNTLYAQNKNNRLTWIKDWMRFHQREQQANAVLLLDNGSTDYTPDELLAAMQSVDGFDAVTVVTAPLPFMPIGTFRRGPDCNFFQPSMHSLLSRRFLRHARAVLSLDIDELLLRRRDRTIFDAAAANPFGAVCFSGHWVYAPDGSAAEYTTHRYRRSEDAAHRGKYCYRPQSFMGRGWQSTHMIQKGIRNPICQHVVRTHEFEFLHHRSISTSWASDRSVHGFDDLVPDPDGDHVAAVLNA